ncbi:MAG: hypothetical protein ABGW85_04370, partial [Sulfurimonas sp.]
MELLTHYQNELIGLLVLFLFLYLLFVFIKRNIKKQKEEVSTLQQEDSPSLNIKDVQQEEEQVQQTPQEIEQEE